MPDKKPLIARGESYASEIKKPSGPVDKYYPRSYEEAKVNILNNINEIQEKIVSESEIFFNEKILSIRMEQKFEAKSYMPNSLAYNTGFEIIGGRKYAVSDSETAKLYFMRIDNYSIEKLCNFIKNNCANNETAQEEIMGIKKLDFLLPEEKYMGFSNNWEYGSVEVVMHPLYIDRKNMIKKFYDELVIEQKDVRIKNYDNGFTFISLKSNIEQIEKIKKFNTLRSIHPLGKINITPLRGLESNIIAPCPSTDRKKSIISVGVFDGGVNTNVPLLKGYVDAYESVKAEPNADCINHGTAVCGIILHGNLNNKLNNEILKNPIVSVNSFRVLPVGDDDIDLYESVDAIEKVVKERKDIKLYNISFGPVGPILDDSINRFTYALDRLTYDVNVAESNPLFVVAVGNDGKEYFNRIQSPSDIVNGLGIGAYTLMEDNKNIRAEYSCIGPGREGAKIKPDMLEFGGDYKNPCLLVSTKDNILIKSYGTSFSAPLVVHKIGEIISQSEDINPHLARALLIHNANLLNNKKSYDNYHGYGFCTDNVEDLLECSDNKVTILYSGIILNAKTIKLPVFLPNINTMNGKAKITWTIASVVNTSNDTDAYTANSIEDTFYSNSNIFSFTKKDEKKTYKLNIITQKDRIEQLIADGYKKSKYPAADSTSRKPENELRNKDLKWETIIKKSVSKYCKNLYEPYITLHAIGRSSEKEDIVKYNAIVTIEVEDYTGSLYDSIFQTFQNLTPIRIRTEEQIMLENYKQIDEDIG